MELEQKLTAVIAKEKAFSGLFSKFLS